MLQQTITRPPLSFDLKQFSLNVARWNGSVKYSKADFKSKKTKYKKRSLTPGLVPGCELGRVAQYFAPYRHEIKMIQIAM